MSGVATFTNNPNANTGIKLAGSLGPAPTTIQGGAGNIQGQPITIQGSGAPSGGTITVPHSAAATQNDALSSQTAALLAQIAQANQKVYAPALDTNALYSQASNTAAANVNPYYTKLLNDFIGQQGTARQQQQQQTDVNIQNLKDQLTQIEGANTVSGNRATEDTATTEAGINQAADYRQIDQGTGFDTARNAEATALSQSGLTGSGLGAGKQATTQGAHDVTEARQATADQEAKDASELTKARTFEDLATSNTNATSAEGKGETQTKFDLNKFITGQTSDLQQYQGQTEIARQNAIVAETAKQNHILTQNFINSIANPAQREAAIQAYGSI